MSKSIGKPSNLMTDFIYMYKAMVHVFSYLDVHDLLSASQVSSSWKLMTSSGSLVSYFSNFFYSA